MLLSLFSTELVASKGIIDPKILVLSPSLVVDKRCYGSVMQNAVMCFFFRRWITSSARRKLQHYLVYLLLLSFLTHRRTLLFGHILDHCQLNS